MNALSVILLVSVVGSALTCDCVPDWTLEDAYCRADFGILVYVENDGYIKDRETRVYKVKLLAAYKLGTQNKDFLDKTHVYTAENSAACGVILDKGKFYALSGYYEMKGKWANFRVGLCGYLQKFDTNPIDSYKPPNCNSGY